MKVSEAIEYLVSIYGDIDAAARSMQVNASEVFAATAEPDTAEAVALDLLKKYNPYTPPKATSKD
jgi:hypothetical protein